MLRRIVREHQLVQLFVPSLMRLFDKRDDHSFERPVYAFYRIRSWYIRRYGHVAHSFLGQELVNHALLELHSIVRQEKSSRRAP